MTDWVVWAGRLNQLSLVPFLALLWTLWHIPGAPRKTVVGFTFYLAFIAVAIPAGLYCRQHLGTSMANVDLIHGPCEALLTTANLLIVLGLRDAIRSQPPAEGVAAAAEDADGGRPEQSAEPDAAAAAPAPDEGLRAQGPIIHAGSHNSALSTDSPKLASHHCLPPLDVHPSRRGPGIIRAHSSRAQYRQCCFSVGAAVASRACSRGGMLRQIKHHTVTARQCCGPALVLH